MPNRLPVASSASGACASPENAATSSIQHEESPSYQSDVREVSLRAHPFELGALFQFAGCRECKPAPFIAYCTIKVVYNAIVAYYPRLMGMLFVPRFAGHH